MGPDDELETSTEQQTPEHATRTVHHMRLSEMEPLRALPEDEESEREEDEQVFEPGPIFGEGM